MTLRPGPDFDTLFDPDFLVRAEALALRVEKAQRGGRLADQRTAARGQGSDFVDFKPYVAGDDLRTLDLNIYRRLGKPFVRVFEERQDLPVYMLLDISRSMYVEAAPRILPAMRVVLALAAAALGRHNSISLFPVAADMTVRLKDVSGRVGIARIAEALAGLESAPATALSAALSQLGSMKLRRGLVVVVSDFFDDAGLDAVIDGLSLLPHRLLLVQMTRAYDSDPTLAPDLHGDVILDDGERQAPMRVTITPDLIERYRAAYRRFSDRLDEFAMGRGAHLLRIDADRDVLDQLVPVLGPGGVAL